MFTKRRDNQLSENYEPDCEDYWLASLEDRANEGDIYKEMWEELKERYNKCVQGEFNDIQELEQKYNIGRGNTKNE